MTAAGARGGGAGRVYLDWNATAPLRAEARAAMLQAMDEVGNPSSVHAEGRRARAIVERARAQVAEAAGCAPADVTFTSGATEAAALAARAGRFVCAGVEHPCVAAHAEAALPVDRAGRVDISGAAGRVALQAANSETGVLQDWAAPVALADAAQAFGKTAWRFDGSGAAAAMLSAHKIGGPTGVGALIAAEAGGLIPGGGQEQGRRGGTENVIGVAGFGAAAEAARRDLADGVWERVEALRDRLEDTLADAAPGLVVIGGGARRAPNVTCLACAGWRGETQVMAMDLAGFAVSAGSACSSGRVERASRTALAMGYGPELAESALRVSLGPDTTAAEVMAFADAWIAAWRRWKAKAA